MNMTDLSDLALVSVLVGGDEAQALLQDGLNPALRAASDRAHAPLQVSERGLDLVYDQSYKVTALDKIGAAMELASRVHARECTERSLMSHPEAAEALVRQKIGDRSYEVFMVLFLDASHRLISAEEMFKGTINQTAVYPREVMARVFALNAAAIICAHNHPSGDVEPSRADEVLTANLRKCLGAIGVELLAHLIVGPHSKSTGLTRMGKLV